MGKEHLTELKWKTLASKQKVKDNTVQKALAAFNKIENGEDYDKQLESLNEVISSATKLKPKVKDDKDVNKFLDEMVKEAKGRIPDITKLKNSADAKDDDDDGGDVKKLLARIRSAGEKRVLQFMVCKKGSNRAVTFAKKIGQKHRDQLKKQVGVGAQFVKGDCAFEEGKFTFITDSPMSGMAKTIKKALLAQTGKADYKVCVRDDEKTIVLDDETDIDDEGLETSEVPPPPPMPGSPAVKETDNETSDVPGSPPLPDPSAEVLQRLKVINGPYQQAIATDGPTVAQMQTLYQAIRGTLTNKDYEHAIKLLDELEPLVNQATDLESKPTGPSQKAVLKRMQSLVEPYKKALDANVPNANQLRTLFTTIKGTLNSNDYEHAMKLLDELEESLPKSEGNENFSSGNASAMWKQASEAVVGQLGKLDAKLRQLNEPDLKKIADKGIQGVTQKLRSELASSLALFDQASQEDRAQMGKQVQKQIAVVAQFITSDRRVKMLDTNPFAVPVTIQKTVGDALVKIKKAIS